MTISTREDSPPKVENFIENTKNESEFRRLGARSLDIDFTLYMQGDAKGLFRSDVFGIIVYEAAKKSSPNNPLDPAAIKTALGSVWPSVFTYLTTTFLIQDAKPRTVVGQQMRAENRLFVYPPVAWMIIGIMFCVAICNASLIYTAERCRSILEEEPVGNSWCSCLIAQ